MIRILRSECALPALVLLFVTTAGLAGATCPARDALFDLGVRTWAFDIAASDDHVVTVHPNGLTVWDATDPLNLEPRVDYVLPFGEPLWYAVEVELDDRGFAYLMRYYGNGEGTALPILVLDLRHDPPLPAGWLELPDEDRPIGLDLSGDLMVLTGDAGAYLFDISKPTEASLVAEISSTWSRAVLSNDHLFIVSQTGMDVFDVRQPESPELVTRHETSFGYDLISGWAVDGLLITSTSEATRFFDISDPAVPTEVAGLSNHLTRLSHVGHRLYAATSSFKLVEIDVSDPSQPTVLSTADTGRVSGMAARGATVWACDYYYSNGILSYDTSSGLELAAWSRPTAFAFDVAARSDLAVVALGRAGLDVVSLDEPMATVAEMSVGYIYSVDMAGDLVYATGGPDLRIIDISTPAEPQVIGTYRASDHLRSVHAFGDMAILTSGFSVPYGWVVDVSDPTNPTPLSNFPLGYYAGDVVSMIGDVAIVSSFDGLLIYDLSDPASPSFKGSFSVPGCRAGAVLLDGATGYLPCVEAPSYVLDLSDPLAPVIVGELAVGAFRFTMGDGFLGAMAERQISFIDITEPSQPVVRSRGTVREANWSAVAGDRLLVLADPYLEVITPDCSPPEVQIDWTASGTDVWLGGISSSWVESYQWEFGDGTVSTAMAPFHVYQNEGIYTVTLTVMGDGSTSTTAEVMAARQRIRRPGGRAGP